MKTTHRYSVIAAIVATVAFCGATCPAPEAGGPAVVYVDNRAPVSPPPTGMDWAGAFPFLQDAIAHAKAFGIGEIRVAHGNGPYRPDQSFASPGGDGDKHRSFDVPYEVTLLGGWAGLGDGGDIRDVKTFETVISGDLNSDDLRGEYTDNSYHLTTVQTTGAIDGFTLVGGRAAGSGDDGRGGAVRVELGAQAEIRNCTFIDNHAVIAGACIRDDSGLVTIIDNCTFIQCTAARGAGVSVAPTGNSHIFGCTFANNTATDRGGAIFNSGEALIQTSLFTGNDATNSGGGIRDVATVVTTIESCVFEGNTSDRAGALSISPSGVTHVVSCVFDGNTATDRGGAIRNAGVLGLDAATFVSNSAPIGGDLDNRGVCFAYPGGLIGANAIVNLGEFHPASISAEGSIGATSTDALDQFHSVLPADPAGMIIIDVDDGASDTIDFTSPVMLSGGVRIDLADGYVPSDGDCVPLVTGASAGSFDAVYIPEFLPTLRSVVTGEPCGAIAGPGGLSLNLTTMPPTAFVVQGGPGDLTGVPTDIVVASLNPGVDPHLDIAIIGTGFQSPLLAAGSIVILAGDGTGGFAEAFTAPIDEDPTALDVGDIDGDGWADIVVAARDTGTGVVNILLNDPAGTGSFALQPDVLVGDFPMDVSIGALDPGSPLPDLAVAIAGAVDEVVVLSNNGDGTFTDIDSITLDQDPTSVAIAEYSGDAFIDIGVTVLGDSPSTDGEMVVINGDGLGGFLIGAPKTVGPGPRQVDPGDFDNNKDTDAMVINGDGDSAAFLANEGGGLKNAVDLPLDGAPVHFTLMDFEGDADTDMAVIVDTGADQVVRLVRNDRGDDQLVFVLDQDLDFVDTPILVASGDFDNDGFDDLITILIPAAAGADWASPASYRVLVNDAVPPPTIPGDINRNGVVDTADLLQLLAAWGPCGDCPEDIDDNGTVDVADLLTLLANWS